MKKSLVLSLVMIAAGVAAADVAGVAAEDVETEIDLSFAGGTREKIKIARADGFVRTLAAL